MPINFPGINPIQIRDNQVRDYYFKEIVSFSHILGMMSGIVTDYVTSAFGDHYFNAIWNSMEEPYVQRSAAYKDVMNKPKPTLLILPKFDPSDESSWRPLSEFDSEVENEPDSNIRFGLRGTQRIFDKPNFQLYFRPRRYKMTYEMSFLFDSDVQRMQAQNYIRQNVRHRLYVPLNRFIENFIPNNFMLAISCLSGYPIGSKELDDFLNKDCIFPIRRRMRTGSGKNEYFASIKTPIQLQFTDAPSSSGPVKRGNLVIQSMFNESIDVEFVAPAIYFLRCPENIEAFLAKNKEPEPDKMDVVSVNKVLEFSVPDPADEIGDYIKYKAITIQADKNGDDKINILDLITDSSILDMIRFYKENKLDIDFINIILYEDLIEVNPDRVSFDRSNIIYTMKDLNIYKNYHLVIYVCQKQINAIKDSIFKTEGSILKTTNVD